MSSSTELKIRDGIKRAMSVSKLRTQESFLSYPGILPLNLPEGTRGVILPDAHIPAHHRRLFWAVLRFIHAVKPHVVIAIGDWNDIFALSRHPKPLRTVVNAQGEFDEG